MEIRHQRVFLAAGLLLYSLSCAAYAQETNNTGVWQAPTAEQREVIEDVLDSENFAIGVQTGVVSIEDFGVSTWLSAQVSYHLSEYFYIKASAGQAKAGQTSFEKLANVSPLLSDEERQFKFYGLAVGYNLLPGESFLTPQLAFNNALSIELGGGNTQFAGNDQFTLTLGINYRLFLTDWLAWDVNMSDYMLDTQITGENKSTHNLNLTTGFAVYF
ncbi:outer membrane beta-barrel domain-containing protein [Catenovulum sediminis]|uniref:Outer membrane beta-barrel domain-containing protein n=1 Tax=Catenovulum sediminis TaxID=1740262 RepID=A0ABV1RL62_9ALTE|nr:outer membrane beta-barrel domain-containing protein [Catenovulum sediminis]